MTANDADQRTPHQHLQPLPRSIRNQPCGFGLDYLDTDEDAQLPDELQEHIDSGELFFWDATGALDFQGQLEAYGAISGRRKLPWRYHWPDAVRDDVLARLLALNAQRYEEEVAMGLHSKGAKQAAKAAGAGGASGKRRGGRREPPRRAKLGASTASRWGWGYEHRGSAHESAAAL
jgi:hypothetical protein